MSNEVKIAYLDAVSLEVDQLNNLQGDLKSLTEENFKKLRGEILNTGFAFSPHVWQDPDGKWYLIDGHQRIRVLNQLKKEGMKVPSIKCVPVVAVDLVDAKRRVLQGVSQYGDLNQDKYFEFISTEALITVDEASLRFENPQIDYEEIRSEHLNTTIEGEDEIPEQVEAKTKLGDLYRLGDHRLLCGDSTDASMVSTLVGSERMDMVFTDPPYGISFDDKSNSEKQKKHTGKVSEKFGIIKNDDVDIGEFVSSIFASLGYCNRIFIWGILNGNGNVPPGSFIVWDKKLEQQADVPYGDFDICWSKNVGWKMLRHVWGGFKNKEKGESRLHPTQKPISLIQDFFERWGKAEDKVVDLFGGSGSTLIACEKTKRKCFMMELDPHYCDVIVARWEKFTGKQAEKITNTM